MPASMYTYRARGLPSPSVCDTATVKILLELVLAQPQVDAGTLSPLNHTSVIHTIRSHAPSPKPRGLTEGVATFTIDAAVASRLVEDGKTPAHGEWSFEVPADVVAKFRPSGEKRGIRITIDTIFDGFTVLCSPAEYNVDIIAIPSLGGHPYGSFVHRQSSGDFMWLLDQLPKDFPNARLLTYGYKSYGSENEGARFQRHGDVAATFRHLLCQLRKYTALSFKGEPRPIIFITQCLSGLIVKEALAQLLRAIAISSSPGELHTFQAVRGVLLFGTPTGGLVPGQTRALLKDEPDDDVIRILSTGSQYLGNLKEDFANVRKTLPRLQLVSFYELQATPITQGQRLIIVDRASATADQGLMDKSHAIDTNHCRILKFRPEDQNYNMVLEDLDEMLKQDSYSLAIGNVDSALTHQVRENDVSTSRESRIQQQRNSDIPDDLVGVAISAGLLAIDARASSPGRQSSELEFGFPRPPVSPSRSVTESQRSKDSLRLAFPSGPRPASPPATPAGNIKGLLEPLHVATESVTSPVTTPISSRPAWHTKRWLSDAPKDLTAFPTFYPRIHPAMTEGGISSTRLDSTRPTTPESAHPATTNPSSPRSLNATPALKTESPFEIIEHFAPYMTVPTLRAIVAAVKAYKEDIEGPPKDEKKRPMQSSIADRGQELNKAKRQQVQKALFVQAVLGMHIVALKVVEPDKFVPTLSACMQAFATSEPDHIIRHFTKLDKPLQYAVTAGLAFCAACHPMNIHRGFGSALLADWKWGGSPHQLSQKVLLNPETTAKASILLAFDELILDLHTRYPKTRDFVSSYPQPPRSTNHPRATDPRVIRVLASALNQTTKELRKRIVLAPTSPPQQIHTWTIPSATWTSTHNLLPRQTWDKVLREDADPGRLLHGFLCDEHVDLGPRGMERGTHAFLLPPESAAESLLEWLEGKMGMTYFLVNWSDLFPKEEARKWGTEGERAAWPNKIAVSDPERRRYKRLEAYVGRAWQMKNEIDLSGEVLFPGLA